MGAPPFLAALRAGRFPCALEVTPPRELRPEILMRRAQLLGGAASAIHVIQRPERLSSLEASLLLRDAHVEPVWHVVNRGRTRDELEEEIERAARGGLRSALCIRGEGEDKDGPATPKLRELVAMLCAGLPDAAAIGVTMNQYGPHERVLANLLPKLDAGAQLVQTQPLFELQPYLELAASVKRERPDVFLVPMLMPAVPRAAAERVTLRLGTRLPQRVVESDAAAWDHFATTLDALRASPLADGVAILTASMDPGPEIGARLQALI